MKDCQRTNSHFSITSFRGQAVWFLIDFVAVDSVTRRAISADGLKFSLVNCLLLVFWVA